MSRSSRPYLLRAIYEWLLDNNLTPHLLVATEMPGVQVPTSHAEDGQLVLNISPDACRHLFLGDELVTFSARFSGASMQVSIPIDAVTAIIARENNLLGMIFGQEPRLDEEPNFLEITKAPKPKEAPATPAEPKSTINKITHLTLVK